MYKYEYIKLTNALYDAPDDWRVIKKAIRRAGGIKRYMGSLPKVRIDRVKKKIRNA